MLSIVLAIILGVGFTLLALQNPSSVSISVFDVVFSIPLYLFGALSFLFGIFISSLFHLLDSAGTVSEIHEREVQLKNAIKSNESLQSQLQKSLDENNRLRNELGQTKGALREEKVEHTKQQVKDFFGKIRQSFS
jgi:uncharacterized integral membrane protein